MKLPVTNLSAKTKIISTMDKNLIGAHRPISTSSVGSLSNGPRTSSLRAIFSSLYAATLSALISARSSVRQRATLPRVSRDYHDCFPHLNIDKYVFKGERICLVAFHHVVLNDPRTHVTYRLRQYTFRRVVRYHPT
jgi:hypothetical protein